MAETTLRLADPMAAQQLRSGWADETEGSGPIRHRWTVANTATIAIPTPSAALRAQLTVTGVPYLIPGRVDFQDVWVFVDGSMVSMARLTVPGTIVGDVPAPVLRSPGRELLVSFTIPGAVVPAEMGVGADARKLGFALQETTLLW